ncbi:MAG: hypothetical protein DI569_09650 [Sphingopyxis macrogoltabida]|uniref:DUF304 domain-containing protein n=1 Tax=Sphingopyxis macrogoltabida TaxID=33050 RepID=A0A2W5N764_SPHMC|nr:MAG: hypothetical protein DI569_09650 [Sphingopyxis macrogoltabida]
MEAAPIVFGNHRGVVPLLWAFFGLATIEMLAVHLFVALRWPLIGWPLSIASFLSIVWLIGWIRSWQRLPHELHADVLRLHMGSLRSLDVPIDAIAAIEKDPSSERLKAAGARSLVALAHPNRLLVLNRAVGARRPCRAVAIRLDDPAAFDAAMDAAGRTRASRPAKAL